MRGSTTGILAVALLTAGPAHAQAAASHIGAWKVERFGAGRPFTWAYMIFNADGSACTGAKMDISGADKPSTTGGRFERNGDELTLRTSANPIVFKWVSSGAEKAALLYPKGDLYVSLARSNDVKTCSALTAKGKAH